MVLLKEYVNNFWGIIISQICEEIKEYRVSSLRVLKCNISLKLYLDFFFFRIIWQQFLMTMEKGFHKELAGKEIQWQIK